MGKPTYAVLVLPILILILILILIPLWCRRLKETPKKQD
jgi:hypothetical protein